MSKSDVFENQILALIFNGTPIPGLADNAATGAVTQLWVSLHTADPGEAGNQSTAECNYTGYARVAIARNGTGWVVTGSVATPAANTDFPNPTNATNLPQTATHFAVGTAQTGVGRILYRFDHAPDIIIANTGVTPRILAAGTSVTED